MTRPAATSACRGLVLAVVLLIPAIAPAQEADPDRVAALAAASDRLRARVDELEEAATPEDIPELRELAEDLKRQIDELVAGLPEGAAPPKEVRQARKVLQRALAIDPEYLPALEELKVAERLIRNEDRNVYRKRNLVILFPNHQQHDMVDRAFPALDKMRRRLERDLKYHLPVLWVRVENKVRRFQNPPALYDAPEDTLLVEAATLEAGDYTPVLHQMVHHQIM